MRCGYLEETLALCLIARHCVGHAVDSTTTERILSGDVNGIPESEVGEPLRSHLAWDITAPDGGLKRWTEIAPLCARGIYASASPVCEAEAVANRGGRDSARIPYSEVASFCDVELISQDSEVCRAAYRFVQPDSDPAR